MREPEVKTLFSCPGFPDLVFYLELIPDLTLTDLTKGLLITVTLTG